MISYHRSMSKAAENVGCDTRSITPLLASLGRSTKRMLRQWTWRLSIKNYGTYCKTKVKETFRKENKINLSKSLLLCIQYIFIQKNLVNIYVFDKSRWIYYASKISRTTQKQRILKIRAEMHTSWSNIKLVKLKSEIIMVSLINVNGDFNFLSLLDIPIKNRSGIFYMKARKKGQGT